MQHTINGAMCPKCSSTKTLTKRDSNNAMVKLGFTLTVIIITAPIGIILLMIGLFLKMFNRDKKGVTEFTCKTCKHKWQIRKGE